MSSFQANLSGRPSESFQSFQWSPLLGYQLLLIPPFCSPKNKVIPPKILPSASKLLRRCPWPPDPCIVWRARGKPTFRKKTTSCNFFPLVPFYLLWCKHSNFLSIPDSLLIVKIRRPCYSSITNTCKINPKDLHVIAGFQCHVIQNIPK